MPRKAPLTLEELAVKHVLRHKNDRSDRYLAKMNRIFGRTQAADAVRKAEDVYKIFGG